MNDAVFDALSYDETCESEWAWDVDFTACCYLVEGHGGQHRAILQGNGGVIASITWGFTTRAKETAA